MCSSTQSFKGSKTDHTFCLSIHQEGERAIIYTSLSSGLLSRKNRNYEVIVLVTDTPAETAEEGLTAI